MAFRFRLQVLLRLKESQEHQHRILLEQANAKVQEWQSRIAQTDEKIATTRRIRQHSLAEGASSAEMSFLELGYTRLALHRQELVKELAHLRELQDSCLQTYQCLHRDREALDTLRRSQMQRFQIEETRQEQKQIDDFFLLRREHFRRR